MLYMDPVSCAWESPNPGRDPASCGAWDLAADPGNVILKPGNDMGAGKKKRVLLTLVYSVYVVATHYFPISNYFLNIM
jgi:hypothetical protein